VSDALDKARSRLADLRDRLVAKLDEQRDAELERGAAEAAAASWRSSPRARSEEVFRADGRLRDAHAIGGAVRQAVRVLEDEIRDAEGDVLAAKIAAAVAAAITNAGMAPADT
jgi:hypothetical protein